MKSFLLLVIFIIQVNGQVSMQWIRTYSAASGTANDVTVDGSGNVYVTGRAGSPSDILTTKYAPEGTIIWQQFYNGPASNADEGYFIKLDPSGNVIVAGDSCDAENVSDMIVLKYTSTGVLLWQVRYNGGGFGGGPDQTKGVGIGPYGNIFVNGTSKGSGTGSDILIIKYLQNGSSSWVV